MKCLYLYNANSGKGKYKNKKEYIIERLKSKFEEVNYIETKTKEEGVAAIENFGKNYDAIIFSGGDGTVNDVVNTTIKCGYNGVLGYIPSGTCNDFARSLKIPKNLDKALDVIINGQASNYDIFKVNDRYGVYVCASGIFTSASFDTKQKAKREVGKLAYYLHSFGEIFTSRAFGVQIKNNDEVLHLNTMLMLHVNSISVAGYKLNKNVDLHDGKMEFISITQKEGKKRLSLKSLFIICKMFLFGINSVKKYKSVKYFKFDKISVSFSDEQRVNIDGENAGVFDYDICVCENKLNIFTIKN